MGDVEVVISESVGQRVREEEPTIRGFNARNLESTNLKSIMKMQIYIRVTVGAGLTRPAGVRNQQICDLLDSSNVIFTRVNTQQGEFGERESLTHI